MIASSFHSVCAWTFNAGKGGFTPLDSRPGWSDARMDTVGKIRLMRDKIMPRLPAHVRLGLEVHYDYEYDEGSAEAIASALGETGIALAMVTPGAHRHFAYGGVSSPDPRERKEAAAFCTRSVDLAYGPLRKAWSVDAPPSLVLWNGSFGYDVATIGIRAMYGHLKEAVAALCEHEKKLGGELYISIEPKPNEGHPALLIPTVASAILFWRTLEREYGVSPEKKGVNKEFGHSEMIGLDHVYDTVEEIDNGMLLHMHINSQGYNDGIILGGPGKFDIDHGARINGMNVAIAGLVRESGYRRWKGHDMQVRPYDSEERGIDRVVRSILSWEACEKASEELDCNGLIKRLEERDTAAAEDMMRDAVVRADAIFKQMYRP
ncbi:MAG: xylose isomerase [Spirochaetes bacterium]|nr:xylose isomerase [Spirochaetota bacterium]